MIEYWFISACAAWLFFLVIKAFVHFRTIEFEKSSTHTGQYRMLNWIITSMASFTSMILFNTEEAAEVFAVLAFHVATHAVMFSPLLNSLRGKPYFYLGLESGWFDEFFAARPTAYKILYFVGLAAAIASLVVLRVKIFPA